MSAGLSCTRWRMTWRQRIAAALPPRREWPAMLAGYALIALGFVLVIGAQP